MSAILRRSRAVSYWMKQLIDRGKAARDCLYCLLWADHSLADELIAQLMRPARKFFDDLATSMPA
jgi:hypothetical protein